MMAAQAKSLTKTYGMGSTRVVALDDLSIDIQAGSFVAIMGPSGSGKSTLMHVMAGLDRPNDGSVHIGQDSIFELGDDALTQLRRDRIGFVFQAFNLVPTLSAEENIVLPIKIAKRSVDREWFDEITSTLGLTDRLSHAPNQLSGGQQQRVACARALMTRPDIVFADEPTGNLDSKAGAEVLDFLAHSSVEFDQTIVMVTHDPVAASYAERAVFLADGRIIADEYGRTTDELIDIMGRLYGSNAPRSFEPAEIVRPRRAEV